MGNKKSKLDKKNTKNQKKPSSQKEKYQYISGRKYHNEEKNGCKVLDLGCGIGIWEPICPSEIKPVNAEFVKSNILKGLPFKDNEFDYVHTALISKMKSG
ncbi:hypothetical protein Glove_115g24 [Diversispora epigaea]|uniref:Methyltransferase type 11 domain-containing protein n=1 Tax=Diversispora epigaea TaxID=1348612 RepID=A0A397J1A8_9GLOM|nr:hypothetical protein Glove_115g24 [Diversispora epigaea]